MIVFLVAYLVFSLQSVISQSQTCTRHQVLPSPSFTLGKICRESKTCTNNCVNIQTQVCENVNQYVCTTYKRYECVNTCLDGRRTPRSVFSRIIEGKKRLFKRFVNGLTSKKSVPSSPAPPPSRSNGIDYQWKSNPGLVSKINSNYGRRPLPPSPPRRAPSAQRTPSTQRSCSNQRRQECRYVPYREACAFQPVKTCQSVPERECQISCSNIWVCCGSTTTTGGVRPPTVTGVRPPTVTGPPAPPVQPGPPAPPTDINVIVGPPAPGILEDDDEDDGDFVVIEAA